MPVVRAYAAQSAKRPLGPWSLERREPGERDVLIEILYCGICHTDVYMTRADLIPGIFPMVPGHEIVGRVLQTGDHVTRHRIGDIVGVGCMVDSCRGCPECASGEEQFCDGLIATYNCYEKDGKTSTYGGYSSRITVDEHYVLKIPPSLSPAQAAPLLCAGITTYSPLRHWRVGKGSRVGVIGLGGLGHVAVKIAVALGAEVTVFSTSSGKKADAERWNAAGFVVTTQGEWINPLKGHFDLILNTVSADVPYDSYVQLLKRDGTLLLLGIPDKPLSANVIWLVQKRRSISASIIGGIRETQEMLDFCADHAVSADIELIPITEVGAAYQRILKSDVRYRFVIDLDSLRNMSWPGT